MSENYSTKQTVAAGTSMVAAVVLITIGVLQTLQGISALAKDQVFVSGVNYVYKFDITTWGWIHIVFGIMIALVGFGLFSGAGWARVCGILVAAMSLLVNFLWLPYYPWWSIVVIALDIFVIWAIANWDSERV